VISYILEDRIYPYTGNIPPHIIPPILTNATHLQYLIVSSMLLLKISLFEIREEVLDSEVLGEIDGDEGGESSF
jgi:hypothetical protein